MTRPLSHICKAPPPALPVPLKIFTVFVAAVLPLHILTTLDPAVPSQTVTVDVPEPEAILTVLVVEDDPSVITPVD